jgi:hypothetical protein
VLEKNINSLWTSRIAGFEKDIVGLSGFSVAFQTLFTQELFQRVDELIRYGGRTTIRKFTTDISGYKGSVNNINDELGYSKVCVR